MPKKTVQILKPLLRMLEEAENELEEKVAAMMIVSVLTEQYGYDALRSGLSLLGKNREAPDTR